ncbi:hypothetical protein [Micromonospora tarensis]|uniref:Uncharacterized protein n=1 Tax=Micromonospora tarensis TaxID=2806100 RepID=A0ABS1YCJ9_9ACTN|nr:hypothetical protein [Micromonospora tarensis]MBM0275136.1 hypothetical protein [Micromonospora tarensis]
MTTRTQEQILARFRAVADSDWLGFRREVLADSMTLDTLRQAVPGIDTTGRDDYVKPEVLEQRARDYLTFAIGKALDHRGISASRSVDKLSEYAWLLGRDDVVAAMDAAEYEQYGVPKLRAFAEGMAWRWPGDIPLARMAQGLPCQSACADGCGQ